LQQNSQGLKWRSPGARVAVTRIAEYASLAAEETLSDSAMAADLTSAVVVLVDERATRGPLGALESAKPARSARSGVEP
jgi:hypothetical protein